MKPIRLLALGLTLLGAPAFTASAATNGVSLGMNFQAAIDAAAPGDTLLVQPGTYPDASLSFNKPLMVYSSETNGTSIQFLGTVEVTGTGPSYFRKVFFGNALQITGPGPTSFEQAFFTGAVQATGSKVGFVDAFFSGDVNISGGKVTLKRSYLDKPLTLANNAALEALRLTMNDTLYASAATNSGTSFLAVQSQFLGYVNLAGYKLWLGYNDFRNKPSLQNQLRMTNCDSVLIGNKLLAAYRAPAYANGGTLKAYNNLFLCDYMSDRGIDLNGTTAEVINNTISFIDSRGGTGYYGITAKTGGNLINLRDNIVDFQGGGGSVAFVNGEVVNPIFISYCATYGLSGSTASVGVIPPPANNLIQVDPKLTADYLLGADSPCKNAGPPEAIYNNRDGTRNSLGHTGGPYWNPANYTNSNPMVFFLTGQQAIFKGAQTSIPVNAAATAGH